ncbi:hypothetical protein [Peribacillus simplex]|uniref:hypothetical protein n=1 Tax=Peribacillus simplex TaxID=1478 RepID=UPI003D29AAB9
MNILIVILPIERDFKVFNNNKEGYREYKHPMRKTETIERVFADAKEKHSMRKKTVI